MRTRLKEIDERNLKAFDWLPLNRWTVESILGPDTYCKICDKRPHPNNAKDHIREHVKEREVIARREKLAALEAAREARRLAKLEKDAINRKGT